MKKLTFILAFLIWGKHFAQEFPELIPMTPEAINFTRHGDFRLNSSTGKMNYSIPIYTIKAGNNSWPISLQYSYGGLLLESKASLMGLGWSLSGSGAVTREVRGLPDEKPLGYYGANSQRGLIETYLATGNTDHMNYDDFMRKLRDKGADFEVDKYNVNVAGINFSFKINKDREVVYISKHNNIVEIIWGDSNWEILKVIVKDANGIKYSFDVKEIGNIPDQIELKEKNQVVTSWLLSEILYPNNEKIEFKYQLDEYVSYDYSAAAKTVHLDIANDNIDGPIFGVEGYKENTIKSKIERQILNEIWFPNGKISFNFFERFNREVYSSIQIENLNEKIIAEYKFSYLGERDALTRIEKNKQNWYEFKYYGINLGSSRHIPPFLKSELDYARDKDKWGYYNGAGNERAISMPNSIYVANLNPSLEHTRRGALAEIRYPTMGKSFIKYEQNEVKTSAVGNSDFYETIELGEKRTIGLEGGYDKLPNVDLPNENEYRFVIDEPTVAQISHDISVDFSTGGTGHFQVILTKTDNCNLQNYYPSTFDLQNLPINYLEQAKELRRRIRNYNVSNQNSDLNESVPYICPSFSLELGPDGPFAAAGKKVDFSGNSGRILLLPGTYDIKIKSFFIQSTKGYAEMGIAFQKTTRNDTTTIPDFVNQKIGGIRVSSIQNFDSNNTSLNTSFYDYNDDDGFSTGIQNLTPASSVKFTYESHEPGDVRRVYDSYSNSIDFYASPGSTVGTPIYYESIKEYDHVNKINGYTQTNFHLIGAGRVNHYPRQLPRGEFLNIGQIKEKKYYDKDNKLVRKEENKYDQVRGLIEGETGLDFNTKHPISMKVVHNLHKFLDFTKYTYAVGSNGEDLKAIKRLYTVIVYSELDSWYLQKEKNEETHTENGIVNTYQNFKYLVPNFYQPSSIETRKSNGEMVVSKLEYPINYPLDTDMSTATIENMVNANILNPVIKQETEVDNSLNNINITNYYQKENNLFLPKSIKKLKHGGEFETLLRYYDYDEKGNLLEVSKEDGVSVVYVWGYNKEYPIAKIENPPFTYVKDKLNTITLSQQNSINAVVLASNLDTDSGTEDSLRDSLNSLRSIFPNAMVSTYTYDPLIGVTSITDPKGYTIFYHYDEFNRLKEVKDAADNIVTDYEYHYKNQF